MIRGMIFACLLLLGACANTDGPVVGTWRGRHATGDGVTPTFVNLVLHGQPGPAGKVGGGEYDILVWTSANTLDSPASRTLEWGDRWTMAPQAPGSSLQILHLHDLPGGEINTYAMLPDRVLVPLGQNGQPDTSRYGLMYALSPVAPGSRGYGRL